jgi:hypothetical protein
MMYLRLEIEKYTFFISYTNLADEGLFCEEF